MKRDRGREERDRESCAAVSDAWVRYLPTSQTIAVLRSEPVQIHIPGGPVLSGDSMCLFVWESCPEDVLELYGWYSAQSRCGSLAC